MRDAENAKLINVVLLRAAEQLGDITAQVFELFYARRPEARELFRLHDPGNRANLEGSMVEQVIYCLMQWYESPGEIEIILVSTLPHHIETLGVSHELFEGFFVAVCDVIAASIPAEAQEESAAWDELQHVLLELIAKGASFARPEWVRKVA